MPGSIDSEQPVPRIRTAMICLRHRELLCVELRDPATARRFWSVPGGEIHAGETALEAAVRETREETGYDVIADPTTETVTRYRFRWNATVYDCETHWFTGRLSGPEAAPVNDAAFLLGCDWIPVERLAGLLSDHPPIRETVLSMLARAASSEPRATTKDT